MSWVSAGTTDPEKAMLTWIPCRLDLQFVRPGKDAPVVVQAGEAPERSGLLFCGDEYYGILKAGMRLVTISNEAGMEPIKGVFDLRFIPDLAMGFASGHHIEVQVFELIQKNLVAKVPATDGSYAVDLDSILNGGSV